MLIDTAASAAMVQFTPSGSQSARGAPLSSRGASSTPRGATTARSLARASSPVACGQAVHSLASLGGGVGGVSGLILAGGRDKAIRAYDIHGTLGMQHLSHLDRIWALCTLTDGKIASASADRSIRIWRVESTGVGLGGIPALPLTLSKLATLNGHTDAVQALLLHRGRLVSGSADCTIRSWDLSSGAELLPRLAFPMTTPQREISAVHALSHTGGSGAEAETLWSGHWNGSIHLWDAEAGALLRSLSRVHDGCVWALTPLGGSAMASAGSDGAIRLWDARSADALMTWVTGGPTYALASTGGEGACLISAGHDGMLRLWDPRAVGPDPVASLAAHEAPIRSLLVHGGAVWSGSTDGTVRSTSLSQVSVGSPARSPPATVLGHATPL